MIEKRFTYEKCIDGFYDIIDIEKNHTYPIGNMEILVMGIVELLNRLSYKNEQLKKENNKLHQKIFEMRTNIALERTEISKQIYTGKKNEKEYLDAKEFLDEVEKW